MFHAIAKLDCKTLKLQIKAKRSKHFPPYIPGKGAGAFLGVVALEYFGLAIAELFRWTFYVTAPITLAALMLYRFVVKK